MIGQHLLHYHVVAKLGEGGMGEVFRATDTKLGRTIALKVLPSEMARNPDRLARFEREARAVAALNHPNIVTLYAVEQIDGVHFLTMELVDGQSLAQFMSSDGFPIERVLEIGSALADALAAAHDKGIVHRDLKPANVMLTTAGRLKVLDFGLAKEIHAPDHGAATMTAGHTEMGVVMGTPPYMSPEQLAARPIDQRTDIFSLGIMLYEMCSGRRPFAGATSIELASAILRDTPAPLEELRPDVPPELARLIRRCLEKDPQRRVQTARDVGNELHEISRARPHSSAVRAQPAADSEALRAGEGFWIAVLPFTCRGSADHVAALADGLSEEIVTGLSRFSYLRVIARGSTSRYAAATTDVRAIAQEIGARYVLEGSVRQAGTQLRVAVQLVDASNGAHLWAETYNRAFEPSAIFDVQDDLVPRIVSTVADAYGVLPHSMSQALRAKAFEDLTPYEALLRSFVYAERVTAEQHAEAKAGLERAVQQAPRHSDCWAMLSIMLADEYGHGFGAAPATLERAVHAARQAVDAHPANHRAYQALAWALFLRKEFDACRTAGERAIALNGMDASTAAYVGQVLAYSGQWPRGLELIARATSLNPHHPGWYWYAPFLDAYRRSDYAGALSYAIRINLPGVPLVDVALAATHGQLGQLKPAGDALRNLLAARPDYARIARVELGKWFDREIVEHLIDGLRKAGLDAATAGAAPAVSVATPASGIAAVPPPMPSIAVLPFTNMSASADQDYFSDGLAEEIINLLAQASDLKVIARTSAFAFRGKDEDVRKVAQALDVTHVLEGSVRRAGERIRVTAQLIAAADGAHVWSERFDKELSDVFAVQDEIAGAIAKALRVKFSGTAQPRYVPKLPAYEAFLRARHQHATVTPESWELARKSFESAVELDPAFALAHAGLGFYWLGQAHFGFGSHRPHDTIPLARAAAQRALRLDDSLPDAHALLAAIASLYDLDWDAAERHCEDPLARQAGFALTRPIYGGVQFLKGNAELAVEIAARAIAENPLDVWPRMNQHAYLQAAGREREAYDQAQNVLELDPTQVVARVSIAHFHAAWGERSAAVAAARKACEVGPWYSDARATLAALLRVSGHDDDARALYGSLGSGDTFGDCRAQAVYHLLCGDMDAGADWTERAIDERDFSMMYYLRFVICKPLRASPRWPRIAQQINRPEWRS